MLTALMLIVAKTSRRRSSMARRRSSTNTGLLLRGVSTAWWFAARRSSREPLSLAPTAAIAFPQLPPLRATYLANTRGTPAAASGASPPRREGGCAHVCVSCVSASKTAETPEAFSKRAFSLCIPPVRRPPSRRAQPRRPEPQRYCIAP